MRIISQNGTIDLPYDLIAFSTGNNGNGAEHYVIIHSNAFATGNGMMIAKYSSEKKLKKAMAMLHEAYTGVRFVTVKEGDMIFDDLVDKAKNGIVTVRAVCKNPLLGKVEERLVFRFPADDEIEV